MAAHRGYVCGGPWLCDVGILVWSRSTLKKERTPTGHTKAVVLLLSAGGKFVSGSDDRSIRAWDVAQGRCEGVLEGNTVRVTLLAAMGGLLLSGSLDASVRLWDMHDVLRGVEVAVPPVRADSGCAETEIGD